MASDICTAKRLQPHRDLGQHCITSCILLPFGTEAVKLVNSSANDSNFHMSSFYNCGAVRLFNRRKVWQPCHCKIKT